MLFRFFLMLSIVAVALQIDQQQLFAQTENASSNFEDKQVFVPGEIVVKLRSNATTSHINELNITHGAKAVEEVPSLGLYRLKTNAPAGDAKILYQANEAVEYAQPNYIFASLNKDYVTLFDLEARIYQMVPLFQQRFTQMEPKKKLLRSIMGDRLFSQAAKKEGLQNIPEVQRRIQKATEKILAKAYEERIQTVNVSEDELSAYYQSNIEKYKTPAQVNGRAIIVREKREAEEILNQLEAGADFAETARGRSIGPNRAKGGAFGWITKGGMPREVEEITFNLKKGGMSEIIAAPPGYFIVKVEDMKPPKAKPFLEVRKQILRHLETVKKKDAVERKTKELQETYNVKLDFEFLSEVKIPEGDEINPRDTESLHILREVIMNAIDSPF